MADDAPQNNGYVRLSTCKATHDGLSGTVKLIIGLMLAYGGLSILGWYAVTTRAAAEDLKAVETRVSTMEAELRQGVREMQTKLDRLLERKP